jgi:hypothetical protein
MPLNPLEIQKSLNFFGQPRDAGIDLALAAVGCALLAQRGSVGRVHGRNLAPKRTVSFRLLSARYAVGLILCGALFGSRSAVSARSRDLREQL